MRSSRRAPSIEVQGPLERLRAELLRDRRVTEKRMFGTTALCVGGKVFMFPWKETLVLKLPDERVSKLVASGSGELFDPGHGRTSKTWIALYPSARRTWPVLVEAARKFVGG